MSYITAALEWISNMIQVLWADVLNLIHDVWIGVADSILSAFAGTIESIPVPAFVQQYTLGAIISHLPGSVLYYVGLLHLNECFAIIAAGFAFRMGRKVVTLFQW